LLVAGSSALFGQATESPATVARGAWLLESDLLSVANERSSTEQGSYLSRSVFWGNLLLSTGISEHVDVQAGFDGWFTETPGGGASTRHGHGDGLLRMKWNFAGKDGEGFAAALLPQLRLPLSSYGEGAHRLEPGVLLPVSLPLAENWFWGGMAGLDTTRADNGGWDFYWQGSSYLSYNLSKVLCSYVELTGSGPFTAPRVPAFQAGLGLALQVNQRLLCEAALYRGINSGALDWNPVLRFSYAF
jgi:hypothetical protein